MTPLEFCSAVYRGDVDAIRRGFAEFEAAGIGGHGVNLADDHYDWWRVRILGLEPLHAERFKEFVRTLRREVQSMGSSEEHDYPLHLACVEGHCSVAESLWKNGVNVNTRNDQKKTGLHWACYRGVDLPTVRFLLDTADADPEARDRFDDTPLHFAAMQYDPDTDGKLHAEVINLLLDKGADLEARNRYDDTPLYWDCVCRVQLR